MTQSNLLLGYSVYVSASVTHFADGITKSVDYLMCVSVSVCVCMCV